MQLGRAGAGSRPHDTCWWKEEPAPLGKEGRDVDMTPHGGRLHRRPCWGPRDHGMCHRIDAVAGGAVEEWAAWGPLTVGTECVSG